MKRLKRQKDEKVEKMNEEMKKINKEVIEIKDELQKQTGIESEGMAKAILASARGVMKEVGYIDTDIIKTGVIKEKSIVEQLEEKISTCIQSKRKVTEEIERLRKIISDREEYLKELNEEGNSLNRALDILKPLNV